MLLKTNCDRRFTVSDQGGWGVYPTLPALIKELDFEFHILALIKRDYWRATFTHNLSTYYSCLSIKYLESKYNLYIRSMRHRFIPEQDRVVK